MSSSRWGAGTNEEVRHDQLAFAIRSSPFWPLPSQIVASAFATDGDDGKSKRRGGNGRLMTGTFQIVVSTADRDDSGRKLARILAP